MDSRLAISGLACLTDSPGRTDRQAIGGHGRSDSGGRRRTRRAYGCACAGAPGHGRARARRRAGVRRHRLRHPVRSQRLSCLDRLGVSDAVLEKADSPPAVLMFDALSGAEVTRMPTGAVVPRPLQASLHHHSSRRPAPHPARCLQARCRSSTLVSDTMVTRFEERGDGVSVTHRGRPHLRRRGTDRRRRPPLPHPPADVQRWRAVAQRLHGVFAPSCR